MTCCNEGGGCDFTSERGEPVSSEKSYTFASASMSAEARVEQAAAYAKQ